MTKIETDILIIGGGIAGCIAAISLIDTHTVTLIDKLEEPKERIGESLAPAAQRILKELQLLEPLHAHQEQLYIQNLGMQSYWGSEQVHIVDHLRNPDGLGISLNRKEFEKFLRKSAVERGVQCIWPAKLQNSSLDNTTWNVGITSDIHKVQHIQAKFIIDATGRQSHFARSQGVQRIHHDKLIACWVTVPATEENKMSTITASENGWWYSAVVPHHKRVIAFQTDADLIDRSTFKDVNSFLEFSKSNTQIATLLDRNRDEITFHGVVAANSTQLEKVTGQQWAAIGDAAISFDPLSSQGMFNAMANAMQLKELLVMSTIVNHPDSIIETQFQKMYTQQMEAVWEQYCYHKSTFYKAEMRWRDYPFWKRRHPSI